MATTLENLESICEFHGWADRSTAGEVQLDNFINHTLQLLSTLAPWPEYNRIDGAQSFNRSTATITGITGDNATVTVTAASHGFAIGDIVDITATTNYNVSNKKILTVADANTFTYAGDCAATAETSGTATIGDQKTLIQTRIVRIGSVLRSNRSSPLEEITPEEWLYEKRFHAATGPPTMYALRKHITPDANTGSITKFADGGDSEHVVVTSNAHGLINDQDVKITGTTSYNGTFTVSSRAANTFEIVDTWVADDATGTWVTVAGMYKMDMLVYPMPTSSVMLYFTYQLSPVRLVAGADTDWPDNRIWLLAEALRTRLNAKDKDASGMSLYSSEFMTKVNLAFNQARPSYMPVIAKPLITTRAGKWSIQDVGRHNSSFL